MRKPKMGAEILSDMNRNAILQHVCYKGPCSRADLSRTLGLSFPSVSSNVKFLIDADLIFEIGEGNNTLGRKSTLLSFNPNRGYLVGVDIGRRHIRVMCADLAGGIRSYKEEKYDTGNVFDMVVNTINGAVAEAGVADDKVISIGIGIPGIYNEASQTHQLAPFLEGWRDDLLIPKLKEYYAGKNFFFENCVNLGAIGERWRGKAKGFDNMVYLDFGVGCGAAVVLNGQLLRGVNGAAGEIGYMALDSGFLRKTFQEEGLLEQLIPSQIIARYINSHPSRELGFHHIARALYEELPRERIDRIPQYFAMAIINTVSVVNPEIFVIAGKLGCALFESFEREIKELVSAHIPFPPILVATSLDDKANVMGGISLAQQYLLENHRLLCDY